jgi:hypothetical protein
VRQARTADKPAVLVVPIGNVKMEAQHSIPALSLRNLLWEGFTFTFYIDDKWCSGLLLLNGIFSAAQDKGT